MERAYLEIGTRRVFAGALEWPGWCRSARTEEQALRALEEYGARYAAAIRSARLGFKVAGEFKVVERLPGDATTDYGAPSIAPQADARRTSPADLKRLATILSACWSAFDSAAERAHGVRLRTGPRGGGRSVPAMRSHVLGADKAYLVAIGGRYRGDDLAEMREVFLEALAARLRGDEPAPSRRRAPLWTPRYAVRRSAWHALDHAWEIEDRSER